MARILVVDDEQSICWGIAKLGERLGHDVVTASTAERGLEIIGETSFDLVIHDVRLPGMDGLTAMEKIQTQQTVPIVIITAYGDLETAVRAVRQGAFEYIVKPFDLEKVENVIKRALREHAQVDSEVDSIRPIEGIVGKTSAMQEVFHRIALVSQSDACVLLQGESGTGKELVARAIHRYSNRCDGPFVAVNVASLSTSLAESELFGHVRGAFTGADLERTGLLVQANGGTLFLDEVADIPLPTQVKLLRSLDQGEVTPVGSDKPVHTDFRVISATHQDLQTKVEDGSFRHDLFFRLCGFQLDLPALRNRREDIRLLADFFVEHFVGTDSVDSSRWSVDALAELERHPWYGNVREL
ncbi:MAG: sigma-54-dependent Fis family transcriptional regulator, partial [Planctomycetes bacterium]|nr:sigma-54-dependent Fis family transcriptional regulator [Planctomycetota bacterium]